MAEELFEDDGTLACLHIPADESNKRFACKAERQENLIGKTFWLLDFFPEVQTRFGSRYLYKAAYNKDAPDSECFKVFTGSKRQKCAAEGPKKKNQSKIHIKYFCLC